MRTVIPRDLHPGHAGMETVTSLLLDFIRAEDAGERYAFRFGVQEYVLRGAGGGAENLELHWNQALLADLAALHQPGCDPAILQRVGGLLRGFLKSDEWARQETRLLEAVSREQPVVVTLRSAAAELYALPWELLTLGASGQHLGELPSVLVRYEWPETRTAAESPSPRPEGGRVLFAWSAAGGGVPVTEHLRAIQEGARAGHHPFQPQGDVLERASYGRLDDVLRAAMAPGGSPISVLHLLCHGGAAGQTCGLVLDGEDTGEPTIVDAGRLRQLLAPYAGMVRLVVLAACNGGNTGTLGNQLGSIAQALHQIGIGAVIASRFPLSIPGANRFSESFYQGLLGGPCSVESAFLAARRQLARDTSRLDWASLQLYARGAEGHDSRPLVLRPYRGLLAFQPEHSRFFFGRDGEIQEIIGDLGALTKAGAPRLLVIAGASGTGKSSVVLAGAVPRMLQQPGATWVFSSMRPGARPLAALDAALATRTEPGRPLLLVVDQFEELFTQTESVEERDAFAHRLWALAADAGSGVSVLVTLRVDFIGRCGELVLDDKGLRLDKVAYEEKHRVFVAQMTQAQLQEAIERPAQLVGLTLEAGLARRMLQDVEGEPGALPLLQDTLDLLWQQREGRTLTQAAYDKVGGVTGALQRRANAQVEALDDAGKQLARRLLVRLVSTRDDTARDTRRRMPLLELRPRDAEKGAHFERILGRFVDERLLVRTDEGQMAAVEIAHEALIRKWQLLVDWLREDRERLAELEKLKRWGQEWKSSGTLLESGRLAIAQDIERRCPDEAGDDARELLEHSRKKLQKERLSRWFGRAGIMVVAGGLLALGFSALVSKLVISTAFGLAFENSTNLFDQKHVNAAFEQVRANNPQAASILLRELGFNLPWRIRGWLEALPICTVKSGEDGPEPRQKPHGDWHCNVSIQENGHVRVELNGLKPCTFPLYAKDDSRDACMGLIYPELMKKLWTENPCPTPEESKGYFGMAEGQDVLPTQAECKDMQGCLSHSETADASWQCWADYQKGRLKRHNKWLAGNAGVHLKQAVKDLSPLFADEPPQERATPPAEDGPRREGMTDGVSIRGP
ncbi:CHAT domain-containing protein [Archangium gephyra]|nr:CHAT domain-containing protein [Archangium gephyra]REG20519.1 CHAT domain-containing protein [Archangium gephyra]